MPSLVDPRLVVLVVLLDGPKYGMQVKEAVFTRSDGAFGRSNGFVYDLLYALERDQLIEAQRPTASPRGGRPLVKYVLTVEGRQEIARAVSQVTKLLAPTVRPTDIS